jgi:ribonuclease E
MEHDTDVAAPERAAPKSEVDERLAAFRRGAPIPKSAQPAPEPKKPARERSRAPKPVAKEVATEAEHTKGEPTKAEPTKAELKTDRTAPERPKAARPRAQAAKTATAEAPAETPVAAPSEGSETSESSAAPRRRRRRGGRGRGGGATRSGTGQAEATAEAGDLDLESPPAGETPDTQRDDALPDVSAAESGDGDGSAAAPRSRRRRGSRGRGSSRASGTGDGTQTEADDADAGTRQRGPKQGSPKQDSAKQIEQQSGPKKRPARGRRGSRATGEAETPKETSGPMSVEERVASGGPTRGIRSSRSRTGRVGRDGRRRREPAIVPPRITDKLMVITERGERDQIAVLEEDVLVQHYVTRTGAHSMVGNVYMGRVQNVLPGMEAAFVDIGRGRNGVLYAGEVNYSPEDLEGSAPRIEQVLKPGQAVMVQVTKDPMGGKGARLTAQISLPGRFLVFAPEQNLSGISRRLPDEERKKLKSILKKLKPDEHGVIVRTAAEGASEEAITHDLTRLVAQWNDIQKRAKKVKAPNVLYEEPELTVRVFRDLFTDGEFRGLVTDSPRVHAKVMDYVNDVAPDLAPKITLHQGSLSAFEEHRIEEQIHKALDRKVWLPSGGYLIIERTEAMAIVDVNTGKSVGKTNLEETVVNTNLEAAKEVARQLRLRDIGGIIVVDFIDMLLDKNKKQVEDTMKEALALDKTRSQVFEIGPLGLMQVTRKRVSGGLVESFSETCPTCEGRGILINYEI